MNTFSEEELLAINHLIHDRILRISGEKRYMSDRQIEEANKEIDGLYELMYKVEGIYGMV